MAAVDLFFYSSYQSSDSNDTHPLTIEKPTCGLLLNAGCEGLDFFATHQLYRGGLPL